MVVVGAAEEGGVGGVGRLGDRQLGRLPPPPVLDARAAEAGDVSFDGRRPNDVLEMRRRLLAGVEDRDVLAPNRVLDNLRQGARGVMLEPLSITKAAGHGRAVPVSGEHDDGMGPPLEEGLVLGDEVRRAQRGRGRRRAVGERG